MDEEKKQSYLRSLIKKNLYKMPLDFQISKTMHDQVGLSFNDDLDTLTVRPAKTEENKTSWLFWGIISAFNIILAFYINFVWGLGILTGLVIGLALLIP